MNKTEIHDANETTTIKDKGKLINTLKEIVH